LYYTVAGIKFTTAAKPKSVLNEVSENEQTVMKIFIHIHVTKFYVFPTLAQCYKTF